jgi:hypothetical protein
MATLLLGVRRACVVSLLLLTGYVVAGCGSPLRVYTSPTLKVAQQRPQTIAILPLDLTTNTIGQPEAGREPAANDAVLLQQMLYSILLQQGHKRPVTIRSIDPRQLPAGAPVINAELAKQVGADAFLVTKLHRTYTVFTTDASSVTKHEGTTSTTTSTPSVNSSHSEVLLDMALYDAKGQLLWKYNRQDSPWFNTSTRVVEYLMEEGISKFPFRR